MEKNDFEHFRQEVNWPVGQDDHIEIGFIICQTCKPEFTDTFPALYKLMLQSSSILNIKIKNSQNADSAYYLYTWIDKKGHKCGWLCKPQKMDTENELLPEHHLMLDGIGSIQESYNHFDNKTDLLTENMTFNFSQPDYTPYTLHGAVSFIDYIETLARQWLDNIPIKY